jgi:hypothetical protein
MPPAWAFYRLTCRPFIGGPVFVITTGAGRLPEIEETPRCKTCDAIMGIIEGGQEVMKEFKGAPALDAGLLAAPQAVEHYEIAPLRDTQDLGREARIEPGGEAARYHTRRGKEDRRNAHEARAERGQPARAGGVM